MKNYEKIRIYFLGLLLVLTNSLAGNSKSMTPTQDSILYFCSWEQVLLESPFEQEMYPFLEWYKDGQKINEQVNTITVNQVGIYEIYAYKNQSEAEESSVCDFIGKIELRLKNCREICNNNQDDDNDGNVDCADLDCNCTCPSAIKGTLTPSVYDDNNTPDDLKDDTYSFQVTVQGEGTSWIGGGQTGNYGVLTNFGPYPVGHPASFRIRDAQNSSCFFSISANMSACIYLETCTCCKSEIETTNN